VLTVKLEPKQLGLYLNKNIYDHRNLLIWPAYTQVTPELLELAEKRGIEISENDLETGNETLLRAADTAWDELGGIFREAGETGRIKIGELRHNTVPLLCSTLTTGSLVQLLVHLRRKDDQTLRHSIGVAALSVMLGRWHKLPEAEIQDLAMAALLHDIGKLRIARCLLTKPGKLSAAEYEEVKRHTVYGYQMLKSSREIPEICAFAALRHHERWDGTGYPFGLSGYQLDSYSRIIAITDVFHAMSSKRSYKESLPFYQVMREMHTSAFGQYDPLFILTFLSNMMESLIGTNVTLTNGQRALIVALNASDPFLPLVMVNGGFLDLSKSRHLSIAGYE
jgi:putative nucleotidyltransferase with HDIG domain